ncbi:response regulator [Candidatus Halobeggiatoa sp. HSG11]|nr:response regulator [Candidatus Halobeggiatoa sp. HSG11]
MTNIPANVIEYIQSMWMAEMILTYLHIDKQGCLIDWGGYPQHYGLTTLVKDKSVVEQVDFLDGFLDVTHTEVLQYLNIGGNRCINAHIVPLDDGIYVLLFDVTDEHDRQQKMQQQVNELSILTYRQSQLLQELEATRITLSKEKQQLEQASKLKSDFIATLSHELRTPLTSIMGYTKLLDDAKQADEYESNYLKSVKKNANHLLSLIDNVLDQTKLEIGQIKLHPNNCNIKQLLTDLKVLFLPIAQEKGLLFDIIIPNNLPVQLIIDELRFRQILINLITNGIKYTDKGFVEVNITWQNERLEFIVTDSGPGISSESQQKIFTAFHRENTANHLPGVGLGLTISYHLVELMKGQLSVESSPQFGSNFTGFIVADSVQFANASNVQINHTNIKVLLVDDSIDLRSLIELYLENDGYTVMTAGDGQEAIKLALQTKPDIILMDMQMPILDGYNAVQQLRDKEFTKPIIALSGSNIEHDRDYAFKVGCDKYITKPIVPEDLLNVISKITKQ